jgi:hypothetical protein
MCYIGDMRCWLMALAASSLVGQACPKSSDTGPSVPSSSRNLEGQLIYHDGIRKWFELKLDKPECGEPSIQLVQNEPAATPIQILRGCRVKSQGAIYFSSTGYYSLAMYQLVEAVEPLGDCERKARFADYSAVKPDKTIRVYRVDMHVNYEPGDHPVAFRVTSVGKELRPWQAYASYWLTGGFVLYGRCGGGFVVDTVFGTHAARPTHSDEPRSSGDMAMFDPESAAQAGKRDLKLGYTCVRGR